MHRSLTGRALAIVLSFWLPLFMGGAESVVRCPTHSGVYSAAAHGSHDGGKTAAHDHRTEQPAPGNHGPGHDCSCPGPGCCPPAVAVMPNATMLLAIVTRVHEAHAFSTLDLLSSDRDHILPFATAPPAAALAPAAPLVA